MSFNPLSVPVSKYIGAPSRLPAGYKPAADDTPALVPLQIVWAEYGVSLANPNASVAVDLTNLGNRAKGISIIRSLYIDNLGSDGSIYVYFPDTEHMLTCPPYSTAWCPVLSNSLAFTIIGKNFTTNDASQTMVIASNFPVSPAVASELQIVYPQWRCSPQLERGLNLYSNGFTSPAVGDQWFFGTVALNNLNSTVTSNLFGTPYTQGGWIILTDLRLGWTNSNGTFAGGAWRSRLISNGLGGTFFDVTQQDVANLNPCQFEKMPTQYRLNAAETWSWQVIGAGLGANGSALNLHAGYSYQGAGGGVQLADFGTLAQPVVDNATIALGFSQFGGWQFIAPANCLLLNTTWTWAVPGGSNTSNQCYLYSDNAGQPGTLLATGTAELLIWNGAPQNGIYPFPTTPALVAGTKYWIVNQNTGGGGASGWDRCGPIAGFGSGGGNGFPLTIFSGTRIWNVNIQFQFL